MDYQHLDLRNKTFLDFTTDNAIIDEIVGDKYLFLSHITDQSRAVTFLEFAEFTSDKKLAAIINKEFDSYKLLYNE